ncbi:MAG: RlmE family RNA methyltransferase [Rickettsiales bacterium]
MTQSTTKINRNLTVHVKTAKGRKVSSTRWLQRQLNDPYVQLAKLEGYRSRAAYKILEIHDKYKIFSKGQVVVDLGAAPGGWSQVAAAKINADKPWGGKVLAIDLLSMNPILGVTALQQNFLDLNNEELLSWLNGKKIDVVLSDMAASASGHTLTDHLKIMQLCEDAFYFAQTHLKEGGSFIAKILRGGTENELLNILKQHFRIVKHFKPKSSRSDSAEMYVVCSGFRIKETQNQNE